MGNRFHNARFSGKQYGWKQWHTPPSKWMKRWWNKKERRHQDRLLIRHRHDWDAMVVPPEHKISDLWDWY